MLVAINALAIMAMINTIANEPTVTAKLNYYLQSFISR